MGFVGLDDDTRPGNSGVECASYMALAFYYDRFRFIYYVYSVLSTHYKYDIIIILSLACITLWFVCDKDLVQCKMYHRLTLGCHVMAEDRRAIAITYLFGFNVCYIV